MSIADPGRISVDVETEAGRVVSVGVTSSRPPALARIFVGRRVEEVPLLAASLFALCGRSHAVASYLALAAARGDTPSAASRRDWALGLWVERLTEMLRAGLLDWPLETGAPTPAALELLRAALRALGDIREALHEERDGSGAVDALGEALARLGIAGGDAAEPVPGSWFADVGASLAADEVFGVLRPDFLGPADDLAVIDRLRRLGAAFATEPSLPERCPETGALSRRFGQVPRALPSLAARHTARLADLQSTFACLRAVLADGDVAEPGLTGMGRVGVAEGFGVVESPRGRLHHLARLGPDGRIAAYSIVAATEWNFHPHGPFAATLRGAIIGTGRDAHRRVARLAALFDPCVGLSLQVREVTHA